MAGKKTTNETAAPAKKSSSLADLEKRLANLEEIARRNGWSGV